MAKLTMTELVDLVDLAGSVATDEQYDALVEALVNAPDDGAEYCNICHDWDCGGHGV